MADQSAGVQVTALTDAGVEKVVREVPSSAKINRAAASDSAGSRLRIVIVGAGFGGLTAAQHLAGVDARITIIDRHNYHLFQPLLYQVATAALSPANIAAPIRGILRD